MAFGYYHLQSLLVFLHFLHHLRNKIAECFYPLVALSLSAYSYRTVGHFLFTNNQHIRHFTDLGIAYLLAYLFGSLVQRNCQAVLL